MVKSNFAGLTAIVFAVVGLLLGAGHAAAITPKLPFWEDFEPVPPPPEEGGWPWQAEWYAYDSPGNRTTYIEDPILLPCSYPQENCSDVWGPYKFESWPDAANGGTVYSGYRSGRQFIHDPAWVAILHPFTPPPWPGELRLKVMQHDFASILCDCDWQAQPPQTPPYTCDCGNPLPYCTGEPGEVPGVTCWKPSRTNFDVHGWLVLTNPYRTEYYVLAINSKRSWTHLCWATKTDGWNVSSTARVAGWHKMEIVVHPYTGNVGDVEFVVDDVVIAQGHRDPGAGNGIDVNWLRLGGDPALLAESILTNTFEEFWYDEVEMTFTPTGCPTPSMDFDDDDDVDQEDFGQFQACFTGTDDPEGAFDGIYCYCMDANHDNDVDPDDFTVFQACASGPGIAATLGCDQLPP